MYIALPGNSTEECGASLVVEADDDTSGGQGAGVDLGPTPTDNERQNFTTCGVVNGVKQ